MTYSDFFVLLVLRHDLTDLRNSPKAGDTMFYSFFSAQKYNFYSASVPVPRLNIIKKVTETLYFKNIYKDFYLP